MTHSEELHGDGPSGIRDYGAVMFDSPTTGLPNPWFVPDEDIRQRLTQELLVEISDGHPLFDAHPDVLSRCGACDEVLVHAGEGNFGMVHLTWSGKPESPPWPRYAHTGGYVATELAQSIHGQTHDGETFPDDSSEPGSTVGSPPTMP